MDTEKIRDAMRPLTMDYYESVRRYARGILEEMPEDERNQDYIEEAIHETADGAEEVIYTFQAQMVAIISENSEAWREIGELPKENSESVIAYCALREDIWEALRLLDCSCGHDYAAHADDYELQCDDCDCEGFTLALVTA